MRHLWVIEEKKPGKNWELMWDGFRPPEVYRTKLNAGPDLREFRTCMPDDYQYQIAKYYPRVGS